MIRLFDSHCHFQDSKILNLAPKLIKEAIDTGVIHFAVNGVSEKDWHLVKEMSERYPSVIPNFGIHPWFISERTPNWLNTLKEFLAATPAAAVGEIGLDKGSVGKRIDFTDQVEVFRQQLELAKELKKPASVHCVRAFGDLLEILKSVGPFPSGVVLHSYLGSAEMVPEFSKLGAYFSFSGFLMSMKESKAKKMLKSIPPERILLETDAPDAQPKSVNPDSLFLIEREAPDSKKLTGDEDCSFSNEANTFDNRSCDKGEASALPEERLNHPANIHHVLAYVARLLEMKETELAELSYQNAVRLFSYEGSKLVLDNS
ncbi:UNVERIFIED_CONTAM: putative metal-dependent hydrolase YabD [Sesamum calycinum]|uniref:Metal-dependent hydrolase YabD n=1 Tax=Sesamum calycinum TaxID=2727403 RepID=A0AAW2Q6V0_9LAMI